VRPSRAEGTGRRRDRFSPRTPLDLAACCRSSTADGPARRLDRTRKKNPHSFFWGCFLAGHQLDSGLVRSKNRSSKEEKVKKRKGQRQSSMGRKASSREIERYLKALVVCREGKGRRNIGGPPPPAGVLFRPRFTAGAGLLPTTRPLFWAVDDRRRTNRKSGTLLGGRGRARSTGADDDPARGRGRSRARSPSTSGTGEAGIGASSQVRLGPQGREPD